MLLCFEVWEHILTHIRYLSLAAYLTACVVFEDVFELPGWNAYGIVGRKIL